MSIQSFEKLIINGNQEKMHEINLPDDIPHIKDLGFEKQVFATNCYRGYTGTWKIEDGKFYLVNLDSTRYHMTSKQPIFADWFSGTLIVHKGKVLDCSHVTSGYVCTYEETLYIDINKGIVDSYSLFDSEGNNLFDLPF